jgi:hypothetical protein
MNSDDDNSDPDDGRGASESVNPVDVPRDEDNSVVEAASRWISVDEHHGFAHADWHNASISRDIDALVQLKRLRKAL